MNTTANNQQIVIPLTLVKGNLTTKHLHRPGSTVIWQMLKAGWQIAELRHQAL